MHFETLLQQLKSQKKVATTLAFRDIYKSWFGLVKSVLNKLGSNEHEHALSCFNEGFLILKKNANNDRLKAKSLPELRNYFVSVCRNYWLEKYDLNPMKSQYTITSDKVYQEDKPIEESNKIDEPKLKQIVHDLLTKISERCRERILYSKYFSADKERIDISASEIAEEMNYTSPRAATKALNKCLDSLQRVVEVTIAENPEIKSFLNERFGIRMRPSTQTN